MMWSLTQSQTSWSVKSSEPQEASLLTKLVEMMELQMSYFKCQKMMLFNCCTQHASKFGKFRNGHTTRKGQFSVQSQRKAMPKNVQTTTQLCSLHMLASVQNVQNPSCQASGISRCSSWIQKRQRQQRDNCQHLLDYRKNKEIPEKHLFLLP